MWLDKLHEIAAARLHAVMGLKALCYKEKIIHCDMKGFIQQTLLRTHYSIELRNCTWFTRIAIQLQTVLSLSIGVINVKQTNAPDLFKCTMLKANVASINIILFLPVVHLKQATKSSINEKITAS